MPKVKIWLAAYDKSKKIPKVLPDRKHSPVVKVKSYTSTEPMILMHELEDNRATIVRLKKRNREIKVLLGTQKPVTKEYLSKDIKLYALRLEDGCYYVGMSRSPERRYKKHGGRKGAMWTRLHKPVEIIETRNTGLADDGQVSKLEDLMTLEYAQTYGIEFVRGGGYCQMKPHWPLEVMQ